MNCTSSTLPEPRGTAEIWAKLVPSECCINLPSVAAQQRGIIRALAGRLGKDLAVSGSVWPPAAVIRIERKHSEVAKWRFTLPQGKLFEFQKSHADIWCIFKWKDKIAGAFPCNEFIFLMILCSMSNAEVNCSWWMPVAVRQGIVLSICPLADSQTHQYQLWIHN